MGIEVQTKCCGDRFSETCLQMLMFYQHSCFFLPSNELLGFVLHVFWAVTSAIGHPPHSGSATASGTAECESQGAEERSYY